MSESEGLSMSKRESLLTSEAIWQAILILWYLTQGGKVITKLKTPVIKYVR